MFSTFLPPKFQYILVFLFIYLFIIWNERIMSLSLFYFLSSSFDFFYLLFFISRTISYNNSSVDTKMHSLWKKNLSPTFSLFSLFFFFYLRTRIFFSFFLFLISFLIQNKQFVLQVRGTQSHLLGKQRSYRFFLFLFFKILNSSTRTVLSLFLPSFFLSFLFSTHHLKRTYSVRSSFPLLLLSFFWKYTYTLISSRTNSNDLFFGDI